MKYILSLLILVTVTATSFAQQKSTGYSYSEEPELIDENEMTTEDEWNRRHGYSNEEDNVRMVREEKKKKRERRNSAGSVGSIILETTLGILLWVIFLL